MAPMKDETRSAIRVLYFVDQIPLADIAHVLGLSRRSVRRALVIRGGVSRRDPIGPFQKENNS